MWTTYVESTSENYRKRHIGHYVHISEYSCGSTKCLLQKITLRVPYIVTKETFYILYRYDVLQVYNCKYPYQNDNKHNNNNNKHKCVITHNSFIIHKERNKILTWCILGILFFCGPYVCYVCSVIGGRVVHALLCFCCTCWDWHV